MPWHLAGADWLHGFEPFSAVHAAVVAATAALAAGAVAAGRGWRGTPRGSALARALGGVGLLVWLAANGWWLLPEHFDPAGSLPLHISDVVGLAAPLALLSGWPPARAVLYFWGFGLTTQSFISPVLTHGPVDVAFWLFWLGHVAIIVAAVYDVAVLGFRPTWRDYRLALLIAIAYAAVALAVNLLLDANYALALPMIPYRTEGGTTEWHSVKR